MGAKSNAMIEAKAMSRSKSPIMHKKSYSVAVENRLQSELVSKLNKMNVAGTNIKIIKHDESKRQFSTQPPKTKSKRSGSRDRKRKGSYSSHPISLLTPSTFSAENNIQRSHSSDSRNREKHKKHRQDLEKKNAKKKKKKKKKRQSVIGS